jgi:hypothetical protein
MPDKKIGSLIFLFCFLAGCTSGISSYSNDGQNLKSSKNATSEQKSLIGENEDLLRRISPISSVGVKTYRNDQYGFALDYPSDWLIAEYPNRVRFDTQHLDSTESIAIVKSEEKSADKVISNYTKEFISDVAPFEVDGEKGTIFKYSEFGIQQHILVERKGYLYHFTTGNSTDAGYLKNFRFTQPIDSYSSSFAPRFEGDPATMFYDPR